MSLRLEGVTLTFADGPARVTALDDVSLTAAPGTVTAVSGPSGSGKSSLLAVAATLVAPDAGSVVVDGVDAARLTRAQASRLRRRRIGIVFQQPNLIASLTAVEQLQLIARLDGRSPRAVRGRALALLDAVGLGGLAQRRPHQLSGGQRQRVAIARALMGEPAVLLADEPTSALDGRHAAAVVELLCELTAARGTATVLVTHDRLRLARADAVCELVDGRLRTVAEGPSRAVADGAETV